MMKPFFLRHPVTLLLHFLLLAGLLFWLHRDLLWIDLPLSDAYYHAVPSGTDSRQGWLLPKSDATLTFWLHTFINKLEIVFGIACIALMILSFRRPAMQRYRRALIALVASLAMIPGSVGFLKHHTYRYCPGQLERYGGPIPISDTSGQLLSLHIPDPRCWPAAHPAAGFALMALAFLPGWHRRGVLIGIGIGVALGWVQIARGEHFLSHVIATFLIALFVQHVLYVVFQRWQTGIS